MPQTNGPDTWVGMKVGGERRSDRQTGKLSVMCQECSLVWLVPKRWESWQRMQGAYDIELSYLFVQTRFGGFSGDLVEGRR